MTPAEAADKPGVVHAAGIVHQSLRGRGQLCRQDLHGGFHAWGLEVTGRTATPEPCGFSGLKFLRRQHQRGAGRHTDVHLMLADDFYTDLGGLTGPASYAGSDSESQLDRQLRSGSTSDDEFALRAFDFMINRDNVVSCVPMNNGTAHSAGLYGQLLSRHQRGPAQRPAQSRRLDCRRQRPHEAGPGGERRRDQLCLSRRGFVRHHPGTGHPVQFCHGANHPAGWSRLCPL